MHELPQAETGNPDTDAGFTLVELLVTLAVLGALVAIAFPSYVGFKSRGEVATAKANLTAALPSVEAYFSDRGSYATMTIASLKASYDAGFSPTVSISGTPSMTQYCLQSAGNSQTWYVQGPGGAPTTAKPSAC